MIDRNMIGADLPPHTATVEASRLRFFARAVGETNPIYVDEAAARAAGYRALPAPPTYTFCLDMEKPNPFELLDLLGVDVGRILHGEQQFEYHGDICAGDTLTFRTTITDIYDKKDGALEFIIADTAVDNQDGRRVVDMRKTVVVRN